MRAFLWRMRWLVVLLVLALVAYLALPGILQAIRDTTPTVVLSRSVEAGRTLDGSDVRVAQVAAGLVPEGALTETGAVLGKRVTSPLPAGMPLVEELLAESGALAGAPAGTVVVPVRLSDASVAKVIHAGDRIDVMASAGSSADGAIAPAQKLADSALVLDVPPGDAAGSGLVLLAVTAKEATLIGGAASWSVLSAVLVG
jgi:Flp pilus assembly protein CpaB